ncbi:LLM class flavin-dependent oxidoreductase [Sphingomonas sp. VDB2]|uniref:LLM class flavin-dependent oxidoreductase n=1 Tax=Sphingomonas sp. VDB2 TaxID=3228751 RepID=UPI003A800901
MYIGVFLGPFSEGPHQDREVIDFCIEQAIAAADAGFSTVSFGEQHFNNYEPYCNPFMIGARVAPFLRDTWLATTVLPLPLHQPFRLAEQMNLLDLLAKGKVVYGISAGRPSFSADHENFGVDPKDRTEAYEAKLDLLLRAFAHKPGDEPIIMDTKWDRGRLVGRLMPASWRQPHPTLAIATNTPANIAQTGAKGWPLFMGGARASVLREYVANYRENAQGAGLDADIVADALAKSLVTRHVFVAETGEAAWAHAMKETRGATVLPGAFGATPLTPAEAMEAAKVDLDAPGAKENPLYARLDALQSWVVAGSPDTVAKRIKADHEDLGIQLLTRFASGVLDYDAATRNFELFVSEVMPQLNAQTFAHPANAERPVELSSARPM